MSTYFESPSSDRLTRSVPKPDHDRLMRRVFFPWIALTFCACASEAPSTAADAAVHADVSILDRGLVLEDAEAIENDAGFTPDAGFAEDAAEIDSGPAPIDLDQDGLDDAYERQIFEEYLPFLSVDPGDRCPRAAIVYRLRVHPADATKLHLITDLLFERDCGAGGHAGDNEVFGATIDPLLPAPEGLIAIRAISHQNTACEHISECGRCPRLTACSTAQKNGAPFPIVFYSTGKHGAYMSEDACDRACFITNFCEVAPASFTAPSINAGEPNAPLVRDLTAAGIITSTAGWTEMELFHYDPWGPEDFGGAGSVAEDLIDDAFLTPACTL